MSDYHLPSLSAADALVKSRDGTIHLIDVRKAQARTASSHAIAGAEWIDPYTLDHAHPVLTRSALAFFCVHGHEVSRFACALARMHGIDAAYVGGGFAALRAAGADLEVPA
ncbi:sulfurtransferase [Roseobacter sp. HKCCA0434]|uniref:rhodanese-like domain-containing protein n=1 Tax=Roseobacter sp. HKCCA0434 TaxID=3079297 RepID=UPI00290585B9|nr:sulfurtransferase [Roseobacter sp. HKCCA0434]